MEVGAHVGSEQCLHDMDAVLPRSEVRGSGTRKNRGGRRAGEHNLGVQKRSVGKQDLGNFYMACPRSHVEWCEARTRAGIKVTVLAMHVCNDCLHTTCIITRCAVGTSH